MRTKVAAARIAAGGRASRSSWPRPEQAAAALAGDPVGTMFHPTGHRIPTRLLWLAHARPPAGGWNWIPARSPP